MNQAAEIANALMGRPRQDVFVCRKEFGGRLGPRYVVDVAGVAYEVGQHILDALRDGWTPQELELEPYDYDEGEVW